MVKFYKEYIYPTARGFLIGTGIIFWILTALSKYQEPEDLCISGKEFTFPIEKRCTVQMNVEGRNYEWTLIPASKNAVNIR